MGNTLVATYFRSSVIYALLGMALGLHMAASHDHGQMPTHAHLMLFGWVGMTIYAVFHRLYPDAASGLLPRIHAVLAHAALIGLVVGLFIIYGGDPEGGDPIAAISSIILVLNMVLFAVIVWKGTR